LRVSRLGIGMMCGVQVEGIGRKKADMIAKAWQEQKNVSHTDASLSRATQMPHRHCQDMLVTAPHPPFTIAGS
jgi:hypothetical protein